MFKPNHGVLIVLTIVFFSLVGANAVAEESETEKDLSVYVCKDVMRLSGQDRDFALVLLHGYMLGKKGTTKYVTEKLAEITDLYLDYCLDHPTENALKSFEKITK